jgi:hypothetical protein
MPRQRPLRHVAGASGHDIGWNSGLELIRGEDHFTTKRYPGSTGRESRRWRESKRKVTGGEGGGVNL